MGLLDRVFRLFSRRPTDALSLGVDRRELEKALSYSINDTQIFAQALSHRSYIQVTGTEPVSSNERLEFLGDAVLDLIVGEYLFRTAKDLMEGDLTKMRARLVNKKALGAYARNAGLGRFVRMSPSALQLGDKGMETILADAFEAIIGAIYLDGGYGAAKSFVERTVVTAIRGGYVRTEDENYKSQLLEYAQANGLPTPRYATTDQKGPDHDRTFTIHVYFGADAVGMGVGKNKKDAEQAAAEQALRKFS
jgi:ribonuclease-3